MSVTSPFHGTDKLHVPLAGVDLGWRRVWCGPHTYVTGRFIRLGRPDPLTPDPEEAATNAAVRSSFRRRAPYQRMSVEEATVRTMDAMRQLGRPSTIAEIAQASGLSTDRVRHALRLSADVVQVGEWKPGVGTSVSTPALWALKESNE